MCPAPPTLSPTDPKFPAFGKFHVITFSNLSAEAEALSGRLPAALPNSVIGVTAERVELGLGLVDHPSVVEGRGASEIPPDMKSSVPE